MWILAFLKGPRVLNNREIVCHISNTQKKKRVEEEIENAVYERPTTERLWKEKGIKNLSMKEEMGIEMNEQERLSTVWLQIVQE